MSPPIVPSSVMTSIFVLCDFGKNGHAFVERSGLTRRHTDAAKKIGPAHGRRRDEFCAINTGAQWLTVSRISATSSTDRAVVDPVSCRLGA
jgi:hypothetical protein